MTDWPQVFGYEIGGGKPALAPARDVYVYQTRYMLETMSPDATQDQGWSGIEEGKGTEAQALKLFADAVLANPKGYTRLTTASGLDIKAGSHPESRLAETLDRAANWLASAVVHDVHKDATVPGDLPRTLAAVEAEKVLL